ncbi:Ger(x)C family spore germination protein [Cohnella rhizosphaerae]
MGTEGAAGGKLTESLEQNEASLRDIFKDCSDMVFRSLARTGEARLAVIYISSLVDETIVDEHILRPLTARGAFPAAGRETVGAEPLGIQLITAGSAKLSSDVGEIVRQLLNGQALVLQDGDCEGLLAKADGVKQRSLEEPSSEPVIRGPRDGFIERISTNMGLLRNRLKTPRLKLESVAIGELSRTDVVLAYIAGIAADSLVGEVRERVRRIRIDGVMDSGYLEEFIEDLPYSPFPQTHSTERPDVVAAELLEGKVAILVDNSPFALIVPMTFWTGLQASEDYYTRWPVATFVRWVRFLFIFIAIFAPSLYVAITTFHQEMIPTNLVLSIASAREAVPFPALFEALLMEIVFEALREAGIRLPKQIGQAISIVGALVIGQAAVQAGIISAPVVIIVSITGIATFTIPRYSFASGVRLLRFPMLFLAGTLGLYGIVLGFLCIVLHLVSLRSFGVPYLAPLGPIQSKSLKDILIRAPIWAKRHRPQATATADRVREPAGQQPNPYRGEPVVRRALQASCLLSACLLSGCWDRTEINDLAFITGSAFDLTDNGDYLLSLQIAIPSSTPGGAGGGPQQKFFVVSAAGKNANEAFEKLQKKSSRKLFTAHRSVILIGEALGRRGIEGVIDVFAHDPRQRLRTYIMVVKGGQAKQLLQTKYPFDQVPMEAVKEMEGQRSEIAVNLRDFFIASSSEGIDPVMGAIEVEPEGNDPAKNGMFKLAGSAVFKKTKMVGKLDERETDGLNWATNHMKDKRINAALPGGQGNVGMLVTHAERKIAADASGDRIRFKILLQGKGALFENNTRLDVTRPKNIAIAKAALEKSARKQVADVLLKLQKEYGADVVGFGRLLHQNKPKRWKAIQSEWNRKFVEAEIAVDVRLDISGAGMAGPPLQWNPKEIRK